MPKAHRILFDRLIEFIQKSESDIPPSANYRKADGEENCGNCSHFSDGYCDKWEADVDTKHISDGYQSMKSSEKKQEMGYSDNSSFYFTDGRVGENDNLIWKTILRTDKWEYRPGPEQTPVNDPLFITRDRSDSSGKIGLEDIVNSFKSGAIEHVTVPLSHKNLVNENTGFVRELKIEDDPDRPGQHILRAGIEFTDQQIRGKVKDSSIANTSAGLFFNYLRRKDGTRFPIALDHVALTNKPWLNGLRPFGMSEDDESAREVKYFAIPEESQGEQSKEGSEAEPTPQPEKSEERGAEMSEKNDLEGLELSDEVRSQIKALLDSQSEEVEKLNQERDALAAEREKLVRERKETQIEDRIRELGEMGFAEQPGFLKVIRQLLLADTGQTSAVLLSEDAEEKHITISDAIEMVIDSLPKENGKVNFGEQAEKVLSDEKPPADAKDENMTDEERLANAEKFLYNDVRYAKSDNK